LGEVAHSNQYKKDDWVEEFYAEDGRLENVKITRIKNGMPIVISREFYESGKMSHERVAIRKSVYPVKNDVTDTYFDETGKRTSISTRSY
jgi:hypothetical protein